jgi:hypothetical protein
MYEPERAMRAQQAFFGAANPWLVVVRPPFYGLLLKPLTWLPYQTARRCWFALQLICICGFVMSLSGTSRLFAAVFCCWSYPLLIALAIGQDLPLFLLAVGLSARLYKADRFFRAGLALSICLIKFHFLFLLPLFVLGRKEWRLAYGFLTGCGVALALSVAAAGWAFPAAYLAALNGPKVNPSPGVMPNLNGLRAVLDAPLWTEVAGALAVMLAVWFTVRSSGVIQSFAGTTAGGLLLSHHAYVQDCSVLIPAMLGVLVAGSGRFTRTIAFLLLSPFVYIPFGQGRYRFLPALLSLLFVLALAFQAPSVRRLIRGQAAKSRNSVRQWMQLRRDGISGFRSLSHASACPASSRRRPRTNPWTPRIAQDAIHRRALLTGAAAAAITGCPRKPLPGQEPAVSILRAAAYDQGLYETVRRLIALHRIDVRGRRVLLKPNLVGCDSQAPINTHPLVVNAVLEALRAAGAAQVLIGEGPASRRDTLELAEAAGYCATIPDFDNIFVDLNLDPVERVRLSRPGSDLTELYLPFTALRSDLVVSLPQMKTHPFAGVTLSMKNWFGLVSGSMYGWPGNRLHWAGIDL